MIERTPPALFITGTDTSVGKTHVTCLIARQLIESSVRVAIYKPVCSGAVRDPLTSDDRWDDLERIKCVLGDTWSDDQICPQRFIAPLAPPIAARAEGKIVEFSRLVQGVRQFEDRDLLLIEGAGGWLSPVTELQTVGDLARAIGASVLMVARPGLGTINHTLLTIDSIRAHGLAIAGIVMSEAVPLRDDHSYLTNLDEIESRSGVPVFGIVPHLEEREITRDGKTVRVNWRLLAGQT